jgi:iron-sulfur cluster repair protein YtfE (RIC family)
MDQALATTLQTLEPLLAKVAEVHGPQDPRLVEVARGFTALRARLEAAPEALAGAAAELDRLGDLTDGFVPPDHACRSYRRALTDMAWLRRQLATATTPWAAPAHARLP